MNQLNAVIVDDEQKNREALERMLSEFCPNVAVKGKAESVLAASKVILEQNPDIVFLDIEMPGGDGFQLLEIFSDPSFDVVFTTAHADYALQALKMAAVDYLLKPINLKELIAAIEKSTKKRIKKASNGSSNMQQFELLRDIKSGDGYDFDKIALPTADGIDFYKINDIVRCEADRAYCCFYTVEGKKIIVSKALKEYEDLLLECNFYRIHKSHMVNLKYIDKYVRGKGGYVILADGSEVAVSVRRKEGLMEVLKSRA